MISTFVDSICEKLPSPCDLTEKKVERLMQSHSRLFSELPDESKALKQNFLECSSSEQSPVIVFVSKMFATEYKALPENRPKALTAEEIAARREQAKQRVAERLTANTEESSVVDGVQPKDDNDNNVPSDSNSHPENVFIAFARVYSGTLKRGSKLYILGPRYDPMDGVPKVFTVTDVIKTII